MRWKPVIVALGLVLCGPLGSQETRSAEPTKTSYRDWLLELGAVPAEKELPVTMMSSKNYLVGGWVNPQDTQLDDYVPAEVRKEYGLPKKPLSAERYLSFLQVDDYKKNQDKELYAAMCFALEQISCRNIMIKDARPIVRMYEAKIGLDEEAIRALCQVRLSPKERLALFEHFGDSRLIVLLRSAKLDENDKKTLHVWSDKKELDLYGRFELKRILAKENPKQYQTELRDFILQNVTSVKGEHNQGWWERFQMYKTLIDIGGDDRCWEAVNDALLNDPITETREQILVHLKEHPENTGRVIDTVLKMAKGEGAEHTAVTPCRMCDGYRWQVTDYLKWIESLPNLDAAIREKIPKDPKRSRAKAPHRW